MNNNNDILSTFLALLRAIFTQEIDYFAVIFSIDFPCFPGGKQ